MVFPVQNLTVRDPGLGITAPLSKIPVFSGVATGGSATVNTIVSIGDLNQVRTVLGYGPLAEDVARCLQKNGGPVLAVVHNSTGTPLSSAAMTQAGSVSPPSVTVSGTPSDEYGVKVTIVLGGTRGTATFKFSLDAYAENVNPTQSSVRATAATYVIPNTGLTLNFPTGTYVAGDTYTLQCIPNLVQTADLASVATVLENDPTRQFFLWCVSGSAQVAATAAALAAAFSGHLTSLTNSFRYVRGFIDVGSGDTSANVHTQNATWTSLRVDPAYGYTLRASVLPFEGYSVRRTSCVTSQAVRAVGELISSDLSRTAAGPDDDVTYIKFDSFYDQTQDTDQVSTMRTWVGMPGFYIANSKLKCPFGSNFTDLQFGRVMDVACATVYAAQFPFISASLRTTSTGTIDPRDAESIVRPVTNSLEDNLLRPLNASGKAGHVSALSYTVDLTWNLQTTAQLKTAVAIRPLGYAKDIETSLFFTLTP